MTNYRCSRPRTLAIPLLLASLHLSILPARAADWWGHAAKNFGNGISGLDPNRRGSAMNNAMVNADRATIPARQTLGNAAVTYVANQMTSQSPQPQYPTQYTQPQNPQPQYPSQYTQPQYPTQYQPQYTTQYQPQYTTQYQPQYPTQYQPQYPTQYQPQYPTQYQPQYTQQSSGAAALGQVIGDIVQIAAGSGGQ